MPIDKKSRYAKVPIHRFSGPHGEERELLELRPTPPTGGVFYATPGPRDRLDLLAYRYFRDPTQFWKICDASDQLDPFDVMAVGEPLLIPPDK